MSPRHYNLLYKLAKYYQIHGVCLKSCFKDFDVHKIGRVTESQVISKHISFFQQFCFSIQDKYLRGTNFEIIFFFFAFIH